MKSNSAATGNVEYRKQVNVYRAIFNWEEISPSLAVVSVITEISGEDPTDLQPLQSAINTDYLDGISHVTDPQKSDVTVSFHYLEYEVTIQSYGVVEIRPVEPES
jgi:hypothetical protein